ncbi:holin [Bacillus thuringiensis]|uniref:holin n=1 Tax=Bacillus cereus group TaxID=86661 RepID=UPI000BF8BD4E|nr:MULTISPECIES: holin [Bacillus cereus group]PEV02455.1 holin [Bacillus thuringiensis]PEY13454.1 holin [Bacillus cereus]PFC28771.1 holin [Bacillus thuringiensis]PHF60755.1 holin [Bacillus wiedmannii]PHF91535.1 holin [Bacillus wiedmannii]
MLDLVFITATTVFAILFVWLLSDTKKDSHNREERLLNHIEKQGEALDRVTDTIEKMDVRLSHIENKVNNNHKD